MSGGGFCESRRRTAARYRVYVKGELDDICFIKDYQELGFTTKEIQPPLNLPRGRRV